ncbi:MAG: hypothetical protein PF690_05380 [Deltaproteobacteria bacterium]|jgi:hypothetical protein|nr:hypothetical protein [Deltaproteobacteria bacterium]
MKKIALILAIISLSFVIKSYSAEQYGFKDIPFGASYEEVYEKAEEIQNRYDEEQWNNRSHRLKDYDLKKWKRFSRSRKRMYLLGLKEKKYVALIGNKYNLGDINVDVYFYFDHNDKFYSFQLSTEKVSANYLETKVYKDGKYITEIFKTKYGKSSKCYSNPNILKIRQGYISYLCKWEHNDLRIYTGISENNMKYYAVGMVTFKPMEEQYEKYKKQKELKGTAKGAAAF